jgi:hypothetical protein
MKNNEMNGLYKEIFRSEHPYPNKEIELIYKIFKEKLLSEDDFNVY